MERDFASVLASGSGSLGYPREVVDDFLAALGAERARLTQIIEEAEDRAARARVAVSNHEIMLTMLVDAQHDLTGRERAAQLEAVEILDSAEREARALLDQVRAREFSGSLLREPAADEASMAHTHVIDLTDDSRRPESENGFASSASHPDGPAVSTDTHSVRSYSMANVTATGNGADASERDEYFDFLRGALADDDPLGPRGD
jgi:hypothetical protein